MKKSKDGKICYRINEFSNMTGFAPAVIRYYESQGYPFPRREENGYRTFQVEDAYRINMFRSIRARGFSISESIALLDDTPRAELCARLEENLHQMDLDMARMQGRRDWTAESIELLRFRAKEPEAVWEEQREDILILPASVEDDYAIAQQNAELRQVWDSEVGITRYIGMCDGEAFGRGEPAGLDAGAAVSVSDFERFSLPSDETVRRAALGRCVCFFAGEGDQNYLRLERHPEVKKYLEQNHLTVQGEAILFYLMLYLEEDGEDLAVVMLPVKEA